MAIRKENKIKHSVKMLHLSQNFYYNYNIKVRAIDQKM